MDLLQILILAIVQGAAELLPVSSSAHVIVAEKLMGLDPTAPEMTLLLVMLHTGTMFAVIVYFWKTWRASYFSSMSAFRANALLVATATVLTGVVGLILLRVIQHVAARNMANFEIETLFGNARLMSVALGAAGLLIIISSRARERGNPNITLRSAAWVGAVQGLCLPFRGFSRSGATISTGLLLGVNRRRAEEFSFALAVVLTPPVIAKEAYRLYKAVGAPSTANSAQLLHFATPSLLGMALSFLAGLAALRWLSRWLEQGHWHYFGVYCVFAAVIVRWIG
ncbi:MAG TPA: undecaprenyl-diphosphate phosphatase [Burkholderiaceae bacterium]|jgi:undecaprenyl-diphosphatase|nr:undecaprenyl-diphosphate phosphatase [Burkholderiaceae bacterium]